MEIVWACAILAFGIFLGVVATYFAIYDGVIRIDQTNPEKDIYRLDIDDIDKLSKKKRILLKVDTHADLSQK